MSVGVQGDGDIGVTETILHGFNIDAGLEQQSGVGVAQSVEANVAKIVHFQETIPFLRHGIGTVGSSIVLVDDVA